MFGVEISLKHRYLVIYNSKIGFTFSFKSDYQIPFFMLTKEYYNKTGEVEFATCIYYTKIDVSDLKARNE